MIETIAYKDIPENIRNSFIINDIRKKAYTWGVRKLLEEYMSAYHYGIKEYKDNPEIEPDVFILENICIYYILRKAFLNRMSPRISARGKKYIMKDNKELLIIFDNLLYSGIDKKFEEAQEIVLEIIERINFK